MSEFRIIGLANKIIENQKEYDEFVCELKASDMHDVLMDDVEELETNINKLVQNKEKIAEADEKVRKFWLAAKYYLNKALGRYSQFCSTRDAAIDFIGSVSAFDDDARKLVNNNMIPDNFNELLGIIEKVSSDLNSIKLEYYDKFDSETRNKLNRTMANYNFSVYGYYLTKLDELDKQYAKVFVDLDDASVELKKKNKRLNNLVGTVQFVNDLVGSVLDIVDIAMPLL